jgi:hypothetical protein
MPPSGREQTNQPPKRQSSEERPCDAKDVPPAAPLKYSSSIDDEIGSAIALAFAIELMGFGLDSLGDDYSKALITVTQQLIEHLNNAKASCSAMREEVRKARAGTTPAPGSRIREDT